MAPGECTALVEDLIADFAGNPDNDPGLVDTYAALDARLRKRLARALAPIWPSPGRCLGHYRALIENTRRRLHPNMRALTVRSNRIGVNAIFAQRVLNAALAPDARIE